MVDDNDDNRDLAIEILRAAGYDTISARNGEEGVAMALAHRPDLVVMDLGMPVLDGWEATRRLREDPRSASIPILVLSAYRAGPETERALAAGAARVLEKPCDPIELVGEVRTLLAART